MLFKWQEIKSFCRKIFRLGLPWAWKSPNEINRNICAVGFCTKKNKPKQVALIRCMKTKHMDVVMSVYVFCVVKLGSWFGRFWSLKRWLIKKTEKSEQRFFKQDRIFNLGPNLHLPLYLVLIFRQTILYLPTAAWNFTGDKE